MTIQDYLAKHAHEIDGQKAMLSDEEVNQILATLRKQYGEVSLDMAKSVIDECVKLRIGSIVLNGLIHGEVGVNTTLSGQFDFSVLEEVDDILDAKILC